jgi:hypothetical protein
MTRVWTVHMPPGSGPASVPSTGKAATAKPAADPVLLREGWSFWALVFGPLWLLRHGCWLAGVAGVVLLMIAAVLPAPWDLALAASLHVALCLHGQDARRWTLARRGWKLTHVVTGRNEESATFRLLNAEPRLARNFAGERA